MLYNIYIYSREWIRSIAAYVKTAISLKLLIRIELSIT